MPWFSFPVCFNKEVYALLTQIWYIVNPESKDCYKQINLF